MIQDKEENCCGICAYFEYDSFHDENYCSHKKTKYGLTFYDSLCDYFFSKNHKLKPNKFKVKLKINLELQEEIEAETEEKALAIFKKRLNNNYSFLKGCSEEVEKIREGDEDYPY